MGPVAGGVGDQRPKNMDLAQLPPEVAQQLMEKQPSTSTQQPDGQPSTPTVEPDAEYAQQGSEGIPSGSFVATQDGQLRSPEAPQQQEAVAPKRKKPLTDKPVIDLLPVENLRISPSANWMDPINSSPYVIHLMPMYAMDVKAKIDKGEWLPCSDAEILKATEIKADSTRAARNSPRDDPASQDAAGIDDYTIVWVQRHIHKKHGKDWEFYTLADTQLLSDAVPLEEVELHGIRPYVMGVAILETHKTYPTSVPQLNRGLQDEINEVTNQRIDNVKFVLNKKWFVRRGRNADLSGLVRNVPGGVVMLDDPEKDVREINWPDVTASAFQEQNSLTMESNELLGNFDPASIMQANQRQPAHNMAMLGNSQGTLAEYLLRTFVETFVQPVLRHLVKLEQAYETDQVILKIASKRAKTLQRFGIDEVTDDLLANELTLTVNVGMGATDPMQKLQKFLLGMGQYTAMLKTPVPGINMQEVGKEIFGLLGYSDGTRFFVSDNPQMQMMQQQLMGANKMIQDLQKQIKDKSGAHLAKVAATHMQVDGSLKKAAVHEHNMNMRTLAQHWHAMHESEQVRAHELRLALTSRPPTKEGTQ